MDPADAAQVAHDMTCRGPSAAPLRTACRKEITR